MIRKILFAVVLAIFMVPWTAAYAHNVANADTIPVDIQPAPAASQPAFNVFGNAIGSVIPGDLFFIDCSGNQADTEFNLYITNADALIKNYRFVNLQIGLYTEKESGAWQKITKSTGQSAEDFYITIQDCRRNFYLPGGAKYKVMVDKGCFNAYPVVKGQKTALPEFYVTTSS